MNDDVKKFFNRIGSDGRKRWKAEYEKNISMAPGSGIPMPWMIPAWKRGLELLKEVMIERGEECKILTADK